MKEIVQSIERCILVLSAIFIIISCTSANEPLCPSIKRENAVTFIAVFNDPQYKIGFKRKLVIADFYNPSNFTILSPDTVGFTVPPKFSPDKSKILFAVISREVLHNYQFYCYDLISQKIWALEKNSLEPTDRFVYGVYPIWNSEESGFYFSKSSSFAGRTVLFYNFYDKSEQLLRPYSSSSVYVVGIAGKDTLIVFSNDRKFDGQWGHYFTDKNLNYIRRIKTQYLDMIIKNGVIVKFSNFADWRKDLNLIAFSETDSTARGYKISVSDFEGNYYRSYTFGEYIDDHPVLSPDGKFILFDRQALDDYRGEKSKLMVINRETGEVKEFINPKVINDAVSLILPDF